jgi:selenide,water dikinase
MRALPKLPRPRSLLIGTETRDDAAVVRLDKTRALVATVDFFAPVVDDPRDYGAIAAANAISDVYAMGGKPLFALSVVGFPRDGGHWDVLGEILAGGAEKAHEAGCPIVGGHSVDDAEPKQGDVILLTKALGTGIATSAIKKGIASKELVLAAVEQMKTLNKAAGEVFARSWKNVHALTDVTGFGLLGHLDSLLRASDVRAAVRADAVRVLPGVRALAAQGVVPGGSKANLEFVLDRTQLPAQMSEADRLVLADAQTNGGLLAAVSEKAAPRILKALADAGAPAVELGIVLARGRRSPGIDVIGSLAG